MFKYHVRCAAFTTMLCAFYLQGQENRYVKTGDNVVVVIQQQYIPYMQLIKNMIKELAPTNPTIGTQQNPIPLDLISVDDLTKVLNIIAYVAHPQRLYRDLLSSLIAQFMQTASTLIKTDIYTYIASLINGCDYLLVNKEIIRALVDYTANLANTLYIGNINQDLDIGIQSLDNIHGEPLVLIKKYIIATICKDYNALYKSDILEQKSKNLIPLSIVQLKLLRYLFNRAMVRGIKWFEKIDFLNVTEINVFKSISYYPAQTLLIRAIYYDTARPSQWFLDTIGHPNTYNTGWIHPIPRYQEYYVINAHNQIIVIKNTIAFQMKHLRHALISSSQGTDNNPLSFPSIDAKTFEEIIRLLKTLEKQIEKNLNSPIAEVVKTTIKIEYENKNEDFIEQLLKEARFWEIPSVVIEAIEQLVAQLQKPRMPAYYDKYFLMIKKGDLVKVFSIPHKIVMQMRKIVNDIQKDFTLGTPENPIDLTQIPYEIVETLIQYVQYVEETKGQQGDPHTQLKTKILGNLHQKMQTIDILEFIPQLVETSITLGIPIDIIIVLQELNTQFAAESVQGTEERPNKRRRTNKQ